MYGRYYYPEIKVDELVVLLMVSRTLPYGGKSTLPIFIKTYDESRPVLVRPFFQDKQGDVTPMDRIQPIKKFFNNQRNTPRS